MKNVILVTDGLFHPPVLARRTLHKTLEEIAGLKYHHIRSLDKLPGNLTPYSAIVVYIHHKRLKSTALAALEQFISNGGGLLGVHTATASFKNQKDYFKIIGGRFISHGPIEEFELTPVSESTVFKGIPTFTIRDELYLHEYQPGITTHFTAIHQGKPIPAVWTYLYGKGRVCYALAGHTNATMKNSTYQKILKQGLVWVCGE